MKVAQKQANNDSKRSANNAYKGSWQDQLAQIADNSNKAVAQRAVIDGINDIPRMLAQRKQIEGYLGLGRQQFAVQAYPNKSLPLIQAKLTIGQPADKYEQEADRVAAQVDFTSLPRTVSCSVLAASRSAWKLGWHKVSKQYENPGNCPAGY